MKVPSILFFLFAVSVWIACKGSSAPQGAEKQAHAAVGDTVHLSNSIILIFQAANGDYWFGSDKDGLYRFDGSKTTHFTKEQGLWDLRIRSIQEDKHGNIYVSTLGGVNKFDGQVLTKLTPIESGSFQNNWALQEGDLWFSMVGSGGKGPYRYDGKNLYQLEFPKHFMEKEYFKMFPNNPWSPYEVYYIYKDRKNTMWFGTSNFGVCRYDGHSFNWLYEEHLTNIPSGGSFGIRSILEDKNGKFWICNTRNRYQIFQDSVKEKEKVLVRYTSEKGIEGIRTTNGGNVLYFMSAVEDNSGNLWLVTYEQGVWRYDGQNITHFPLEDIFGKTITLFSIYKDNQGTLWLGTHENGVYKFNGKTFTRFDKT
jgi:ligand-binding sensor domain-containing protein